jgi:hypothetical protein
VTIGSLFFVIEILFFCVYIREVFFFCVYVGVIKVFFQLSFVIVLLLFRFYLCDFTGWFPTPAGRSLGFGG